MKPWIKQAILGAIVTAAIANKISIRGPTPYHPPKNSLEGRVILITGGNTGLGLESAKRLAKAGATVVITSRDVNKGEKAVEDIKKVCEEAGVVNDSVYALPLDLCDLSSVKAFPEVFQKKLGEGTRIDVLMNNAGVVAFSKPAELTVDGYERTFQTNHLGHFALTALLSPLLAKNARVINVSSGAYEFAKEGLDFENLNGEKLHKPFSAYAASKLENIFFTHELQRRAEAAGSHLKAFAVHPGVVRTDIQREYFTQEDYDFFQTRSLKSLMLLPFAYFTKSVERGATTQVWLASGQGEDVLKGGEYLQNCKVMKVKPFAMNLEDEKELWSMSERLSGVQFQI